MRRLRVLAFDPSLATRIATASFNEITVAIPWEELAPGPVGEYIEVVDVDPASGVFYYPVDLDDPHLLARDGLAPSESNPQFHQQMVYAVAMTTIQHFERALGRKALWADRRVWQAKAKYDRAVRATAAHLSARAARPQRLLLAREEGAALRLLPGRRRRTRTTHRGRSSSRVSRTTSSRTRRRMPFSTAFIRASTSRRTVTSRPSTRRSPTSWRSSSTSPIRPSSRARSGAPAAISTARASSDSSRSSSGGRPDAARRCATPWAASTRRPGKWKPRLPDPHALDSTLGAHDRGAILVAAVFRAFLLIYRARTADLFRIATQGTGTLPEGEIHPDLTARLAQEAARCADRVLQMCIRAIDYCPPVDITFGGFLRGVITADLDFSPEDRESFRIVFIESFREWGIYPTRHLEHGSRRARLADGRGADQRAAADGSLQHLPDELRGNLGELRATSFAPVESRERPLRRVEGPRRDFARCLHDWLLEGDSSRSRLRAHLRARDRSTKAPSTVARRQDGGPAVESSCGATDNSANRPRHDVDRSRDRDHAAARRVLRQGRAGENGGLAGQRRRQAHAKPDFYYRAGATILVDPANERGPSRDPYARARSRTTTSSTGCATSCSARAAYATPSTARHRACVIREHGAREEPFALLHQLEDLR